MVCTPWHGAPTLNAGNDKSVAVCVAPSEASAGEAQSGACVSGMNSTVAFRVEQAP